MMWVGYKRRPRGYRKRKLAPYVSINRRGEIVLNRSALKLIDGAINIVLFFDAETKRIGIRGACQRDRDLQVFHARRYGRSGRLRVIRARSLLKQFNVNIIETIVFNDAEIDMDGQLILDLPSAKISPTYHASALAMAYASIINDSHAFGSSEQRVDPIEAETKYFRFRSELVLYTARLCESLIKQLLYCTDFNFEQYEKAALGGLMSARCIGCQNAGKKHFVSMLGSLAHRYGLCHTLDNCLHEKMEIVNTDRNSTAAHAGAVEFRRRPAAKSRAQLLQDVERIGNEFIHMLNHILDLENRMINEIEALVRYETSATIEIKLPFLSNHN